MSPVNQEPRADINRLFPGNNGLHNQYSVEDQLHGRMAAIANMVNQGGIPPGLGSDPSAAANIANIANLAMRLGVTQVLPRQIKPKHTLNNCFVSSQIPWTTRVTRRRRQSPTTHCHRSPSTPWTRCGPAWTWEAWTSSGTRWWTWPPPSKGTPPY